MTFNIHRSITTETLCRLVLLFYVSFLCFWFFFKKEKYTLKNAWLSLKSATCVFPLTAYQDFTEFLSNHSFGKITPYLGCFSAHTGVKIRSLDLMKTIYQFEWRVIFLPNLVLANYHPSVSSPLSFINYQLMKVKGNPGFLWKTSHPHIFLTAHAASRGGVTPSDKTLFTLFCIHELADADSYLVLLWLTGEWTYATPLTQIAQPILVSWPRMARAPLGSKLLISVQ